MKPHSKHYSRVYVLSARTPAYARTTERWLVKQCEEDWFCMNASKGGERVGSADETRCIFIYVCVRPFSVSVS